MDNKCRYCINKEACEDCKKDGWYAKFIPSDEVRKNFNLGYNGVRGFDGKRTWDFDTQNPELKPTHVIIIEGKEYCPYCGERMFPMQNEKYATIGHCCLCEGAIAELVFRAEKEALLKKHQNELYDLENKYKESLVFDMKTLFDIKQNLQRKHFDNFYRTPGVSFVSQRNNERCTNIDKLIN